MGIKVHLQSKVSSVTPNSVHLQDSTTLSTSSVIWTAGVEANAPATTEQLPKAAKNKVVVRPTLQLPDHPQVYVVGDVAYVEQDGEPLVGVAQEALQQGATAARNIKRQLRGLALQPFDYNDKGTAAIIARNAGVAQVGRVSITGFWAWLLWLGVHLYYLPGWSNRFGVLNSWLRDYLRGEREVRQIFPSQIALVPVVAASIDITIKFSKFLFQLEV